MNRLRSRLNSYSPLSDGDWEVFSTLKPVRRSFDAGAEVISEGQPADRVFAIEDGWACRYRMVEDGRRQITNFMLPGDIFDLQALGDLKADHTVSAITKLVVFELDSRQFLHLIGTRVAAAKSFWWAAVQEESILREQLLRVGRLTAKERIGSLLLELLHRFSFVEGRPMTELPLPMGRNDIADALGLTPVHVSRTFSVLKKSNLIVEDRGQIRIPDVDRLARASQFDADYLHIRALAAQS